GIITVKGFTPLTGGGADQYYMATRALLFYLGQAEFYQAKKTINVDGQRGTPLLVCHLIDGRVIRRPDTVVSNQNVHLAEPLHRSIDQCFSCLTGGKLGLYRSAPLSAATFRCKLFCLGSGPLIVKHHASACLGKHPHYGGADPP